MTPNARTLKAVAAATDRKNHHKLPTLGPFVADSGPGLFARCLDCDRRIYQFANGTVGGTATERECGDRVPRS